MFARHKHCLPNTHIHASLCYSGSSIPAVSTFSFSSLLFSSLRRIFSLSRLEIATSDFHLMAFNRQIVSVFVFEMRWKVIFHVLYYCCCYCFCFCCVCSVLYSKSVRYSSIISIGFCSANYNNFNIPLAKWYLSVRIRFMPIANAILIHLFSARVLKIFISKSFCALHRQIM